MSSYDVLIVGSGLFGATFAHEAAERGLHVLVIEKRSHIGGNCYTEQMEGIAVHRYGAHIFRTSDRATWDYIRRFCEFNNFVNSPIANYQGELYNLPFNMNTFHELWGVSTPAEAKARIDEQRIACAEPANLEEHVLDMVGSDIYHKLVKGYTEKQWGRPCSELPASIIRRIPLRFTYDNNYYNDRFQGIPIGGFTPMFERLLADADVSLDIDFLDERAKLIHLAPLVVYTGTIDSFYDYRFGPLGYRSLHFEHKTIDEENHQGVAVMNFTDRETPYTRIIEHKHFEFGSGPRTVISYEYPATWNPGDEPYYPMEDEANHSKYDRYLELASGEHGVRFGGRLGEYRYYDMQDTIRSARAKARAWLS